MSGLNGFAGLVLRIANAIAGRDREEWLLAMAAETDAANGHGTRWALGCLYAAARDRATRDRWFIAALIALPALTLILSLPLDLAIFFAARTIGLPDLAVMPLMFSAQLPAAWLLGRMRPGYSPVFVGTVAFAVHQAIPLVLMWAMFGTLPPFWSANMTWYNLPAPAGLLVSWLVFVAATWWGGAADRHCLGNRGMA